MSRGHRTPRSPASQLAGFIARFDPAIGKLVRGARAALRKRWPTAVEIVYDNYNALAIGFATTERTSDVLVSLAVYARGVNLYFMYGARLPDPDRLLQGSGNEGRFIPLESLATLRAPGVPALLLTAVRYAKTPLARTGRGRTEIRSVSKKQRPRRPPPGKRLKLTNAPK